MPPSQHERVLADSAQGMKFLILIQVFSRASTFIANQLVLRYLSPKILGAAAQFELLTITTVFFSRESFRNAIQRQPSPVEQEREADGHKGIDSAEVETQSIINLSFIPVVLGVIILPLLSLSYHRISGELLTLPFFDISLILFGLSAIVELLAEPCFAVIQQKLLFRKRALVETGAALVKCAATLSVSILASQLQVDVGTLPFAAGQFSYSCAMLIGYWAVTGPVVSAANCSLSMRLLPNRQDNLVGLFSRAQLSLSANMYFQSLVKHVLTQGDSIMLAALSTLEEQGTYALASNYGGLIARMLFQPIEENSRNTFAKLLSGHSIANPPNRAGVRAAKSYINDIIRFYGLIALAISCIGSKALPLAFKILMGPRWSTQETQQLLGDYCFYIPFLAFNGITEAFVSATADNAQLRQHSVWMAGFSAGFAIATCFFLQGLHMGARGLVWANILNMTMRTLWSISFVAARFEDYGSPWSFTGALPNTYTQVLGLATLITMSTAISTFKTNSEELVASFFIALIGGSTMLFSERRFLLEFTKSIYAGRKAKTE